MDLRPRIGPWFDGKMELLITALLGAVLGWAATHFLPGLWRKVRRVPDLRIFVETDPAIIWAGAPPWVAGNYVVPDTTGLGAPPSEGCPAWYEWLLNRGAVPGDWTEVEVTFIADSDLTIVVDGLRPKAVKRERPSSWRSLLCAVGGADITPRQIRIDLETFEQPTVSFYAAGGEPSGPFRLSLAKGEVEKVRLEARAQHNYFEWTTDVLAIVNGKRRVLSITDGGRPFRTCGTDGLPTHVWDGSGKWQPPLPA